MYRDPLATAREWRELAAANKWSIRDLVIETGNRQAFVGSPATVAETIDSFVQADASDGFILVPHITPAASTPSPTPWSRCSRSAACTAPSTRARPCATTSASPTRTTCATSVRRHEIPGHHPDRAPAGPDHRRAEVHARPVPRGPRQRPARRGVGLRRLRRGERHERPFISSSPPVVLSHVAALTRRIRLFTAVTTLSLLDPVRAYEDYATLDHLSDGRLDLIIGKGNGAAQRDLFDVTPKTSGTATPRATRCSARSGARTR